MPSRYGSGSWTGATAISVCEWGTHSTPSEARRAGGMMITSPERPSLTPTTSQPASLYRKGTSPSYCSSFWTFTGEVIDNDSTSRFARHQWEDNSPQCKPIALAARKTIQVEIGLSSRVWQSTARSSDIDDRDKVDRICAPLASLEH
jgi:hypothetical protein